MPKAPRVKPERLFPVFGRRKELLFDEKTNSIQGTSHQVWKDIEEELDHEVSAKYAYTIVLENRYNIREKLGIELKITSTDSEVSTEQTKDKVVYQDQDEEIFFDITLSLDEWKKIYPDTPIMYNRSDKKNFGRKYFILTPFEWTDVIQSHFYKNVKTSCSISFKRAKIYENGELFLHVKGQCTSCSSSFVAVMSSKPDLTINSVITLNCSYIGLFSQCVGGKKRRIMSSAKRNEYIDKMNKEKWSASFLQKNEANKLMNYGDPVPSHLPTANTFRIMKHQERQQHFLDKDPIVALIKLKSSYPYNEVIHDIGYDPFFLHYWSTHEINTYRMYSRKCKVPRITIDATGSLIRPIELISERKTRHIFLYMIGVMDYENQQQFSVGNMLGERHNHNAISFWLSEWLKNNIDPPKLIVTDFSLALMMAVARSFTQYSTLSEYLQACSSLLLGIPVNVPKAMIRNDFNHLMKQFSGWDQIKCNSKRFKRFYLQTLALIVSNDDYEDTKTLFEYFFVVALNEEDGLDNDGNPTPCELAKMNLKNRIGGDGKDDNDYDVDDVDGDLLTLDQLEEQDSENHEEVTFYAEICNIYQRCLKEANKIRGRHDNFHYCPSLAKSLLKFAKYLPCWGAIMNPIFGFGSITESSATAESLFKEVKHNIFNHINLPTRIDEFVTTHANFIMGNNKMFFEKYNDGEKPQHNDKNGKKNLPNEKQKNDSNSPENEDPVENWGGFGKEKKRAKKCSNYLSKDPTVLHYKENNSNVGVIGVLLNGNKFHLQPIKLQNNHYTFSNTCPFDSIVHILCTSFADSQKYAQFVTDNESFHLFKLVISLIKSGVGSQSYKMRGKILLKMFPEDKKIKKLGFIDVQCSANVVSFLKELLNNYPSLVERSECEICGIEKSTNIPVPVINFSQLDLAQVENLLVEQYLSQRFGTCACGGRLTRIANATNHIFIEPWLISHENPHPPFITSASNIPQYINIKDTRYTLRGMIAFFPSGVSHVSAVDGHYVTFSWREHSLKWEKYDDLEKKCTEIRTRSSVISHLIVYTV